MNVALDELQRLHEELLSEAMAIHGKADEDHSHWICCSHNHLTMCNRITYDGIDPECQPDCPECVALYEAEMAAFPNADYCVLCPLNCPREP